MREAITHALTGAVIGLAVLALGCADKKPVKGFRGPATAHVDWSKCKRYSLIYGALKCNDVVLVPKELDVKQ